MNPYTVVELHTVPLTYRADVIIIKFEFKNSEVFKTNKYILYTFIDFNLILF